MPRFALRLLPLILAILSSCFMLALAQDGDGGYGTYGGGDNTTSPAPAPHQPNVTQPTPPVPQQPPNATRPTQPAPQQPNDTRPNQPTPGGGNACPTAAAADNATAALPITLSNNNSWTHAESGDWYEQNNFLMQNTGDRPICDVSIKVPLANSNGTRIYSSYNVEVQNTTAREMHFDLPYYLHKIWPGQVVSFGYILRQSGSNSTATGGMANVTHARYCEHDDDGDDGHDGDDRSNNHRLRRRRRVLVLTSGWART